MEFTTQELTAIVERSSTLEERLEHGFVEAAIDASEQVMQKRLARWCQVAARGDAAAFVKRLDWDDLAPATVYPALGTVTLQQPLPGWTKTLNAVIRSLPCDPATGAADRCLHPEAQVAFQEVFLPFVQVARRRLAQQTGNAYFRFSDRAHAGLEHGLLGRLSHLCFQTLELEFHLFQVQRSSSLEQLVSRLKPQPSQVHYEAFVGHLLAGQLKSFLQEYTVLARLTATLVDFWVTATAEMMRHLSEDESAIAATFQADTEPGLVVGIRPFLSDCHHNGRAVMGLRFASGLTIIYKPRSLALDVAFYNLLEEFNQQGARASEGDPAYCFNQLPFKTLTLLTRPTHGWVEYVNHTPCQTEAELRRYYQRSGMLLALIYALRGTDFHLENIIVAGDQPVAVDLEMLMHPPFPTLPLPEVLSEAQYHVYQAREDSVLSTMMLPFVLRIDGQNYDISAIGAAKAQELQLPTLNAINTDQMGLVQENLQPANPSISPFTAGGNGSIDAYVENIVTGFEQMYRCLQQCAHLRQPVGWLTPLNQQQGRYLHRNSRLYLTVLQAALRPQFMREGIDFSIELDLFCRPLLQSDQKPEQWSILAVERRAMQQLDIPHLQINSSHSDLILNQQQRLPHFFERSGYAGMCDRVQSLNPVDLLRQVSLIRYAVYASEPHHRVWNEPVVSWVQSTAEIAAESSIGYELLIQQAMQIGFEIQTQAINGNDGSAHWLSLHYQPQQCPQLQGSGFNLFDGNSGISLFLAALYQETGKPQFYDLAIAALQSLRRFLRQDALNRPGVALDIGGGTGLGSVVYALVRISQFLQEPALLEEAVLAARLMRRSISADTPLDLLSGAAGALLGLLTLHQATCDGEWLQPAIALGDRLLTWNQLSDRPMGMASGSAGVAYVLGRLNAVTEASRFLSGAEGAIAHEWQTFLPTAQNWLMQLPDFSPLAPLHCSWMQGAAGLGLACCGLLPMLDTAALRQELELALALTQRVSLDDVDHLCWGNLGRLEMVWVAAHRLHRPDLRVFVQSALARLFQRWQQVGEFCLFPRGISIMQHPGFFQGTAGIGYQLLRLANPKLPCVLLWE